MANCPVCGEEIERKSNRGPLPTYCGTACKRTVEKEKRRVQYAKIERYCPTCDRVAPRNKMYCDEVCQGYGVRLRWGVRDCSQCGREFLPTAKDQKYCTQECQWASMRDRIECTCKQCGKRFVAKKDRTTFCSRECAYIFNAAKLTFCKSCGKETNGSKYCSEECRSDYELICNQCGKSFRGRINQVYCSDDCVKAKNRQDIYDRSKKEFEELVKPRKCKCCKKVFAPEYGDKRRSFCSVVCSKRYARRQRKGEGQCNSRARKKLRKMYGEVLSIMYEPIKSQLVFERDNWVCGICGQPIDRNTKAPHPLSPSVDHVIALALGGSHTYDNVQAAHFECNWRKADKYPSEAQDIAPDYEAICCRV